MRAEQMRAEQSRARDPQITQITQIIRARAFMSGYGSDKKKYRYDVKNPDLI